MASSLGCAERLHHTQSTQSPTHYPFDQSGADNPRGDLRTRVDTQLGADVLHMQRSGARRDHQRLGDLEVGESSSR